MVRRENVDAGYVDVPALRDGSLHLGFEVTQIHPSQALCG